MKYYTKVYIEMQTDQLFCSQIVYCVKKKDERKTVREGMSAELLVGADSK